jgi:glycosyltransferase involved in cell wall biosynthesis
MNKSSLLTIAIPTFSRLAQLKRCLEALGPQLNELCTCYIADNCSPDLVDVEASKIFSKYGFNSFAIHRRSVNIGGIGNIIHCFEVARTPWVWVLSDDDVPLPNAIESILEAIKQHPEAIAFGYVFSNERRAQNIDNYEIISEPAEFFRSQASFEASLISSCVYNRHHVHSVLSVAYEFGSCYFPHLALLVKILDKSSAPFFFYCQFSIVKRVGDGYTDYSQVPILHNIRYISRMLKPSKENGSLMKGSLANNFVLPVSKRRGAPRLHHIAFATALRRTDEGQCVLRRARRAAGEALEFDDSIQLIPVGGLCLALRLLFGILIGLLMGPVLKGMYDWLSKRYPSRISFIRDWGNSCCFP